MCIASKQASERMFIKVAPCAESAAGEVLPDRPASATLPEDDAADQAEQESQMRACRARMVELLQPGETVLDALRRLAVQPSSEASQVWPHVSSPGAVLTVALGMHAPYKQDKARQSNIVTALPNTVRAAQVLAAGQLFTAMRRRLVFQCSAIQLVLW